MRTFLWLVSSVQTTHGSSRTEEDFRPSHHLLGIADIMTLFLYELHLQAKHQRCAKLLQQTTALGKQFWLIIMAASCRAVLYFHGSRWATIVSASNSTWFSPCPIVSRAEIQNLKKISWVTIIFIFSPCPIVSRAEIQNLKKISWVTIIFFFIC